jgi:hypothetical protein
VFDRLRIKSVAVNPRKTKLGLAEVEYVGHLVSTTGTSFTPEKRLKVLDFPQPSTQKEVLQFMIPLGKYQRTGKLIWMTESSAAFKLCQQAISDCQKLYFLEDTASPILL